MNMTFFRKSAMAIAGCLLGFFGSLSPAHASTLIDYCIVTPSKSWSGQFEVGSVNDEPSQTLPFTISGPTTSLGPPAGSFIVGNYFPNGSASAQWYTSDPETEIGYFSVAAPNFVSLIESSAKWAQLVGAYSMTSAGFQANSQSLDWTTSQPGTFYFGVAPSGVPEIDPAGFGSVAALLTGALGLLERRRLKAKVA